jgi:hypothetical protein
VARARQTRAQRLRARREEQRSAAKRRRYLMIGGAVVVVVAVIALIVVTRLQQGPLPGEAVASLGNQHLDGLDEPHVPYNTSPPTSGPHVEMHADSKISSEPLAPEIHVHELEHGGVFVSYNCAAYSGDCDQLVSELSTIVTPLSNTFLAPYPDMDSPIALTAWQRIDRLDSVDADRIRRFAQAFAGQEHGG